MSGSDIYLSASQLKTFRSVCKRKWAWAYIAKAEKEEVEATAFGSEVHTEIELWEKDGTPPNMSRVWRFKPEFKEKYPGNVAVGMIDTLLKNGIDPDFLKQVNAVVEHEFKLSAYIPGATLVGKIDLSWVEGRVLEIVDHKTSSDPHEWGLKEEDLPNDEQCILYSMVGIYYWPDVDKVRFRLNYGSSKSKWSQNHMVGITTDRDEVIKRYHTIKPYLIEMAELKKANTNPLDIEPNPESCGMYRGCLYRGRCALTKGQKVRSLFMANTSQSDRIKELMAKAKGAASVPEAPPSPPKEEGKKAPSVNSPEAEAPKTEAPTKPHTDQAAKTEAPTKPHTDQAAKAKAILAQKAATKSTTVVKPKTEETAPQVDENKPSLQPAYDTGKTISLAEYASLLVQLGVVCGAAEAAGVTHDSIVVFCRDIQRILASVKE